MKIIEYEYDYSMSISFSKRINKWENRYLFHILYISAICDNFKLGIYTENIRKKNSGRLLDGL